jgi:hypothetical protein
MWLKSKFTHTSCILVTSTLEVRTIYLSYLDPPKMFYSYTENEHKNIPYRIPFLLAKYLYNCSKLSSSFLSYQFSSSYKRLVIYFLCKKKKKRSKSKRKRWTRVPIKKERKERYLCSQVLIYFQDLEERSYFQVWSIVELDFYLFLSISFSHHFSHNIKPHMHILI